MKMRPKRELYERVFRRKCPTYEWATIILVITNDVEASSKKRGEDDARQSVARTMFRGAKYIVILPQWAKPGTVAHELLHVVFDVLNESGVELTKSQDESVNDEPWAYCLDPLVNWAIYKLLQCDRERESATSCASGPPQCA